MELHLPQVDDNYVQRILREHTAEAQRIKETAVIPQTMVRLNPILEGIGEHRMGQAKRHNNAKRACIFLNELRTALLLHGAGREVHDPRNPGKGALPNKDGAGNALHQQGMMQVNSFCV